MLSQHNQYSVVSKYYTLDPRRYLNQSVDLERHCFLSHQAPPHSSRNYKAISPKTLQKSNSPRKHRSEIVICLVCFLWLTLRKPGRLTFGAWIGMYTCGLNWVLNKNDGKRGERKEDSRKKEGGRNLSVGGVVILEDGSMF